MLRISRERYGGKRRDRRRKFRAYSIATVSSACSTDFLDDGFKYVRRKLERLYDKPYYVAEQNGIQTACNDFRHLNGIIFKSAKVRRGGLPENVRNRYGYDDTAVNRLVQKQFVEGLAMGAVKG